MSDTVEIDLDSIILRAGAHESRDEGMCVMEAVAFVAGARHSDHPPCASVAIGNFLRTWNDHIGDDETRTRLLRPLVPRIVKTKAPAAIEEQRRWLAFDWLLRVYVPAWLDLVPSLASHAVALRGLSPVRSLTAARAASPICQAARSAAAAAGAAAGDAAWAAAWAAAGAAAWAAAAAAARDAARDAAWDAAWDAAGDAAWAAAGDAARAALQPTVSQLQASAIDLVERMIALS